jgi:uncharacterized protein YndB with AHSA1/START domain
MTRQKSFKQRVRARMDKTSEKYTTARRQLRDKVDSTPPGPPTDAVRPQRPADTAVRERTGRGWQEWFGLLDAWGAATRTHTEIARRLRDAHQVDGWWSQSITVAYEQHRGTRAPGQQSDGTFAAGASRTVATTATRLFDAFADPELRARWLPGIELAVRTATAPKTFRADWPDGTRLVVGVTPQGAAKAQVALQHQKLADARAAARQKAYWRERLTVLKGLLET